MNHRRGGRLMYPLQHHVGGAAILTVLELG